MTLSENSPRPSTPNAGGKPSLTAGAAASAGDSSGAATQPMRMLDSLDAAKANGPKRSSSQRASVFFALGLGLVAAAAYWWWDQSGGGVVSPGLIEASRQSRAEAGAVSALPATLPVPVPPAASASAAVSASVPEAVGEASAGPASIERTATAEPLPVRLPARPFASAPVPQAPRPTVAATPSTPPRVAAARTGPRAVPPSVADVPPPSGDPDVTLLSAMLARLSGDAPTTASPRPTIAQLVERCEARATKDSIEAFECKRRICAGYWGKAEACPMALAPKKN